MSGKGFKLPMGDKTIKLVFQGTEYEGAEVRLRRDVPFGVFVRTQAIASQNSLEDLVEYFQFFADTVLVDWNLEDAKGPIPTNREGFERVPLSLLMLIVQEWGKALTEVSAPLVEGSGNGNTSEELPLSPQSINGRDSLIPSAKNTAVSPQH